MKTKIKSKTNKIKFQDCSFCLKISKNKVMFSGFDDGRWQLEVLGCWGVRSPPGLAKKLARKHPNAATILASREERERRDNVCFGLSCVF